MRLQARIPHFACYPNRLKRLKCTHISVRSLALKSSNDFIAAGTIDRLSESYHWQASPLDPSERWPNCLRAAMDILLPAQAQIVLFGAENSSPLQRSLCTYHR